MCQIDKVRQPWFRFEASDCIGAVTCRGQVREAGNGAASVGQLRLHAALGCGVDTRVPDAATGAAAECSKWPAGCSCRIAPRQICGSHSQACALRAHSVLPANAFKGRAVKDTKRHNVQGTRHGSTRVSWLAAVATQTRLGRGPAELTGHKQDAVFLLPVDGCCVAWLCPGALRCRDAVGYAAGSWLSVLELSPGSKPHTSLSLSGQGVLLLLVMHLFCC